MNTRIHTTRKGTIILQRENLGVSKTSSYLWRKVAGPFHNEKAARQGELRYHKKVDRENPRRLAQQVISRNWKDVKISID